MVKVHQSKSEKVKTRQSFRNRWSIKKNGFSSMYPKSMYISSMKAKIGVQITKNDKNYTFQLP
jgi:hypothetical protein